MHLSQQKDLSLANRLISSLPPKERGLFLEQSELVELKLHTVVVAAGQTSEHAYFPIDSFVSVILPMEDSPQIEVGLVGSEGMFNISLVLGVNSTSFTSVVQGAGRSFRIHRSALKNRLEKGRCLRDVLNRYVDVRESQLAQQAACMNYHTVEQRLARWLLMARDRAHSNELFLTQDVLALMIGVRRESVARAASEFQHRGVISYSRGYLMLLDEAELATSACTCYETDLAVYKQALSPPVSDGYEVEDKKRTGIVYGYRAPKKPEPNEKND